MLVWYTSCSKSKFHAVTIFCISNFCCNRYMSLDWFRTTKYCNGNGSVTTSDPLTFQIQIGYYAALSRSAPYDLIQQSSTDCICSKFHKSISCAYPKEQRSGEILSLCDIRADICTLNDVRFSFQSPAQGICKASTGKCHGQRGWPCACFSFHNLSTSFL